MPFFVENASGAGLSIDDLGIFLDTGEITDLSLRGDIQTIVNSAQAGKDLSNLISSGDLVVKDPWDDVTDLLIADALVCARSYADPQYRVGKGARIGDISDVDTTGAVTGDVLTLNGSGIWVDTDPATLPANQNVWVSIIGNTGITSPNLTTDSLSIIGSGGGIETAVIGDSVILFLIDDLAAVEALATTGVAVRTGISTWTTRTITAGDGTLITNGNGVSGNPTVDLDVSDLSAGGTLALTDEFAVDQGAHPNVKFTIQDIVDLTPAVDLQTVVVANSTTAAIPTTWGDVSWDTTHLENDPSVIEHDNTNTDRILIKETGLYFVSFNISFNADAGEEQIDARVRIDDTTVIPGSLRKASEDDEINDLSNLITAELTAGTYLTLQMQASGTGNTIDETTNFMVTRARGVKGDTGDTGAGSTIIVQEEGVTVTGGPHSTLNFIGAAITATNAGSGVSDITVSASTFGSEYQYAESLGQSGTTSSTFSNKVTFTTPSLPSGDYRIGWSYEFQNTSTSGDFDGRVQLDNSTDLMGQRTESKDSGSDQWLPTAGFALVTSLSGVHTVDLDFANNGSGTASIRNARLEIWRVA